MNKYEQALKDKEEGICTFEIYQDGGSEEYYYDEYTILKLNILYGQKDLIIGMKCTIIDLYNKNL